MGNECCAEAKPSPTRENFGEWQDVHIMGDTLQPVEGEVAGLGVEDEGTGAVEGPKLTGRKHSVRMKVPRPPTNSPPPSTVCDDDDDDDEDDDDDWGATTSLGGSGTVKQHPGALKERSKSYMIATGRSRGNSSTTADGSSEAIIAEEERVRTPTPSDLTSDEDMAFVLKTGAMVRRPASRRGNSITSAAAPADANEADEGASGLSDITGSELNTSTSSPSSRSSRLDTSGMSAASPGLNTSATSSGSNTSVRRGTYWGTYTPAQAHEKRALKKTASTASIDEALLEELVSATDIAKETAHKPNYDKQYLGITRGTPGDREKHAARLRLIAEEEAAKKMERRELLKEHSRKIKKIRSNSYREQLTSRRTREEQHRKRQEFLAASKKGKPSPQMRRKAEMDRPKRKLPTSYGKIGEYLGEARAQASPKSTRKHPFIDVRHDGTEISRV